MKVFSLESFLLYFLMSSCIQYYDVMHACMQLIHPYMTEGYREAVRAIRQIGQDCILRRFKAITNEEEVPNDILTQIIKIASSDKSIDIEDLVDDFVTFYVAGEISTV